MKHILNIVALSLLTALLAGGCAAADGEGAVELFAVNVGKGDALLVRAGEWTCLIDAGKPWAMGRVRGAMKAMGIDALDAVFLTHPDDDHAGGLEWLAAGDIPVGTWYASGIFTEVKPEKHPIVKAAQARGQAPVWLERGDSVPMGDSGAVLAVLAPSETFTDKDDNNSLVMLLDSPQGRMLFTGDMELPQEAVLLAQERDLRCDVLKVPNHADDDTVSDALARACSAQLAVISTSTEEKPETPDPGVVSRLRAAGSECAETQDAELGLWVRLRDGTPGVEYVDAGAALPPAAITGVEAGEDLITVASTGPEADLTGCYLFSERGGELYPFPDGTVIPAGGTLTVGTRTSDGGYDLLWDDKKVVHKSKTDVVTLYDAFGRAVDRMDNGR